MLARVPAGPLLACLALVLGACSSGGNFPGGRHLYGEDGRILYSEIRMETFRPGSRTGAADLRLLVCRDGKVTGTVKTRLRQGEGAVPIEDYGALWSKLLSAGVEAMQKESPDPQGGLYHVIRLTRGTTVTELSAQDRREVLGLSTSNIQNRIEIANSIAEAVGDLVPSERIARPTLEEIEAGTAEKP